MLENNKKQNPFRTPENYFDHFHKDLMMKIEQDKKLRTIPLWKKISTWSAAAALVCGIAISLKIFTSTSDNTLSRIEAESKDMSENIYASSSTIDDNDFHSFLKDEAVKNSFEDVVYY